MNPFNIEDQYQAYLKRVKLDERTMHPEQRQQLRHSFFYAWGQLLICAREDLKAFPEADATAAMDSMGAQVLDFFNAENDRHRAQNN